jgi:hypothetical protein
LSTVTKHRQCPFGGRLRSLSTASTSVSRSWKWWTDERPFRSVSHYQKQSQLSLKTLNYMIFIRLIFRSIACAVREVPRRFVLSEQPSARENAAWD